MKLQSCSPVYGTKQDAGRASIADASQLMDQTQTTDHVPWTVCKDLRVGARQGNLDQGIERIWWACSCVP